MSDLTQVVAQALQEINAVAELSALETLRVHYLGKTGVLTEALKTLGTLAPEARREAGTVINQAKQQVQETLQQRKEQLTQAALAEKLATETIDVTLPGIGQS